MKFQRLMVGLVRLSVCWWVIGSFGVRLVSADTWPTYRHDGERTGRSRESLSLPLHHVWTHKWPHPPAPAWPPPAEQDFWHQKRHQARVTFDKAFSIVANDSHVYFGTTRDDRLVCLELATGHLAWSHRVAAPIRLAPTLAGDRVLFGSDDGMVHACDADTGRPIWRTEIVPGARWIAGNGRIISERPVRTSVFVEHDLAYCCAGIFPAQGVVYAALDIASGVVKSTTPLDASAQGYLRRDGGNLVVDTGRDAAGSIVDQWERRGVVESDASDSARKRFPDGWIVASNLAFAGGDGEVAVFDAVSGAPLWSTSIDGYARHLAVSAGYLLVSTDEGAIHAYGQIENDAYDADHTTNNAISDNSTVVPTPRRIVEAPPSAGDHTKRRLHGRIVASIPSDQNGYGLVVHPTDLSLVRDLVAATRLRWVVAMPSDKAVRDAQDACEALLDGGRIALHVRPLGGQWPYTDYLFNSVVVDNRLVAHDLDDMFSMVEPGRGVLVSIRSDSRHGESVDVQQRNKLPLGGSWTHVYGDPGNTACSSDRYVKGKLALQWFGEPGPHRLIDRHHRGVPPLADDGRLIVPGDERVIAVDQYNGAILWKTELPGSRRVGLLRDCGSMSLSPERLFVAVKDTCRALNLRHGYVTHVFRVPRQARHDRLLHDAVQWGYVAHQESLLIGSATVEGASRQMHERATIEDTYYNERPMVVSQSLFALDVPSGDVQWTYVPEEASVIVNPTVAVARGYVYCLVTGAVSDASRAAGRVTLKECFQNQATVVAINATSGQVEWQSLLPLQALRHQVFLQVADERVIIVGSRDGENETGRKVVWYDLYVLHAATGELDWTFQQENNTPAGGSHGEQDHHPVVVNHQLVVEPFAYDLSSGRRVADWNWNRGHRRGCGTISASADVLFFRDQHACMFDLKSQQHLPVTRSTRPGCWINMIPAGGLLLVPEASSGCSCDFPIQASLAFLPLSEKEGT